MSGEINQRLQELQQLLTDRKLAEYGYKKFSAYTPKKTGNARAHTKLQGNEIQADYPYGAVLDAGRGFRDGRMRGSTQAPKGMSMPTINDVREYIKSQSKG